MISYLKAEAYRITKKKSFLFLLVTFTVVFLGLTGYYRNTEGFASELIGILIAMSPVLISIAIFIMVYTDDLGAHAIQSSIGHGFPRWAYVAAKIIETIILHALVFAYAALHVLLINFIFNAKVDLSIYKLNILGTVLTTFAFTSFASLVAFKTQKSSISITVLVLMFLGFVDQVLKLIYMVPFINQTFPKVIEYFPTELMGSISQNTSVMSSSIVLIVYALVATIVSILVFRNAELEF